MLPNLTLVIQGIAFFAVVWLVMKFGWPHIMAAIEERQQKIAEGLAAADNSQKALAQAQDQVNERSEEHTSELQSLMRISYAVFCLKKKTKEKHRNTTHAPSC